MGRVDRHRVTASIPPTFVLVEICLFRNLESQWHDQLKEFSKEL